MKGSDERFNKNYIAAFRQGHNLKPTEQLKQFSYGTDQVTNNFNVIKQKTSFNSLQKKYE